MAYLALMVRADGKILHDKRSGVVGTGDGARVRGSGGDHAKDKVSNISKALGTNLGGIVVDGVVESLIALLGGFGGLGVVGVVGGVVRILISALGGLLSGRHVVDDVVRGRIDNLDGSDSVDDGVNGGVLVGSVVVNGRRHLGSEEVELKQGQNWMVR